MRQSQAFFQTLRDAPADAELISHKLLLRAGFIQPLGAGIYSYLPLARRSMDKIETIIREEMNAIGGQEITMPVVAAGRPVAADRPLGRGLPGAGALAGPRRPRHDAGHDPRGGGGRPGAARDQLLSPASPACLPPADQVPRRAALARRADPRARVHHEGLLLAGRGRRRAGSPVRGPPRWRISASSCAAALAAISVSADVGIMGGKRRRWSSWR